MRAPCQALDVGIPGTGWVPVSEGGEPCPDGIGRIARTARTVVVVGKLRSSNEAKGREGSAATSRAGHGEGRRSQDGFIVADGDSDRRPRFTDHDFEWEVLTRPAALHGGKSLRARIQRPGVPETEREMTW